MYFKTILFFFISFCLFSCKKEVEKERPEFIGFWYAKDDNSSDFSYGIEIDSNSNGEYIEYAYGGSNTMFHGIARANDNRLKIGRTHGFKIINYPNRIDTANSNIFVFTNKNWGHPKKANWTMTLKGPLLYLGDGVYYKADY
jgi:hypothetical protein